MISQHKNKPYHREDGEAPKREKHTLLSEIWRTATTNNKNDHHPDSSRLLTAPTRCSQLQITIILSVEYPMTMVWIAMTTSSEACIYQPIYGSNHSYFYFVTSFWNMNPVMSHRRRTPPQQPSMLSATCRSCCITTIVTLDYMIIYISITRRCGRQIFNNFNQSVYQHTTSLVLLHCLHATLHSITI
jgi:hypothetical protein